MTDSTPSRDGDDSLAPEGPEGNELPDEKPELTEIDPFAADPSDYEDVNAFVEAEWSESKTARQRVKDVIVRATSPLSAADVATLADVSKPTARKKLKDLSEAGTVLAEATQNGQVYQRDPDWYRIKKIRDLADKPQSALETTLRRVEQEIQEYQDKHETDSPEELILSTDSLDDEAWQDISQWRTALVDREYLRTALQYVSLRRSEDHLFDGERGEDEELTTA